MKSSEIIAELREVADSAYADIDSKTALEQLLTVVERQHQVLGTMIAWSGQQHGEENCKRLFRDLEEGN